MLFFCYLKISLQIDNNFDQLTPIKLIVLLMSASVRKAPSLSTSELKRSSWPYSNCPRLIIQQAVFYKRDNMEYTNICSYLWGEYIIWEVVCQHEMQGGTIK